MEGGEESERHWSEIVSSGHARTPELMNSVHMWLTL